MTQESDRPQSTGGESDPQDPYQTIIPPLVGGHSGVEPLPRANGLKQSAGARCVNPACAERVETGAAYCHACGTAVQPTSATDALPKSRLGFWLFSLLWLALGVAALIFLYTQAFIGKV